MISKLIGLYYRLPWTPNLEANIGEVSHRLQVNSYTITADVLVPKGSSIALKLEGIILPFNELENEPSFFTPTPEEEGPAIATTFIPESGEDRFSIEVTPPNRKRAIEVLSIRVTDLKVQKIEQPFLFDLDGILDRSNFDIRVVSGWCFALNPLKITKIQARLDNHPLNTEYHLSRKDTVSAYPDQADANQCGFECELPGNRTDGTLTLECQLQSDSWIEFFQSSLSSVPIITQKPDPNKPARIIEHQTQSVYSVDNIFIEQQKKQKTKVQGWVFLKDGPAITDVRMLYRDKQLDCRYGLQREDVHREFPGQANAIYSGFEIKVDDIPGNPNLIFQFKTENGNWIEFDQRKTAQISTTFYTDKKIPQSKSGVRANVENAQIGRRYGHQFLFVGWCFRMDGKPIEEIRVRTGKQTFEGKAGLPRKDVFAENKENHPNSLNSGFEIPLDDIPRKAKLKFEYKGSRGRWILFALEDFSRFPVSHFASQSEEKRDFNKWLKEHEALLSMSAENAEKTLKSLTIQPKISIIMPVYNTPEIYLRKAIQSVLDQYYTN
ncbi:MAG: hypothetical protein O7C75_17040, partial [Verrucomicrobia bacterium]|nr:hypothetical protein [Verrucomicrobiota bacterium]